MQSRGKELKRLQKISLDQCAEIKKERFAELAICKIVRVEDRVLAGTIDCLERHIVCEPLVVVREILF